MNTSLFPVQDSEIFVESRCLYHEDQINRAIRQRLSDNGYHCQDQNLRHWVRGSDLQVACFVDDIGVTRQHISADPSQWFDQSVTVITDNRLNFSPAYRVVQAPTWYFGIYYYRPKVRQWQPKRDLHFSINRGSVERTRMLIRLFEKYGQDALSRCYINFNSFDPMAENMTRDDYNQNFRTVVNRHLVGTEHQALLDNLLQMVPIRTAAASLEDSIMSCWLHMVVETYANANVISLSEKIFRALITPVPWVVRGGLGLVDFLQDLGFDVMTDLVQHVDYDTDETAFVNRAILTAEHLKTQNFHSLQLRAQEATRRNRRVLERLHHDMRHNWQKWAQAAVSLPAVAAPLWTNNQGMKHA